LENDVVLNYKVSAFLRARAGRRIRWDDPDVGIAWPVEAGAVILHDRDRKFPLLKDFDSPFAYDGAPLQPLSAPDVF
jgi:dTDP-4-dehydrorhamnose 3,5-epimerase